MVVCTAAVSTRLIDRGPPCHGPMTTREMAANWPELRLNPIVRPPGSERRVLRLANLGQGERACALPFGLPRKPFAPRLPAAGSALSSARAAAVPAPLRRHTPHCQSAPRTPAQFLELPLHGACPQLPSWQLNRAAAGIPRKLCQPNAPASRHRRCRCYRGDGHHAKSQRSKSASAAGKVESPRLPHTPSAKPSWRARSSQDRPRRRDQPADQNREDHDRAERRSSGLDRGASAARPPTAAASRPI